MFHIVSPHSAIHYAFKFCSIWGVFTRIFALLIQGRFSLSERPCTKSCVLGCDMMCRSECTWCQVCESEGGIWMGSQRSWGAQLVWGNSGVKVLLFLSFNTRLDTREMNVLAEWKIPDTSKCVYFKSPLFSFLRLHSIMILSLHICYSNICTATTLQHLSNICNKQ